MPLQRLVVVVAEASLETVPRELWGHPAVYKYARKRGKQPGEVLLDQAMHHQAMRELPNAVKRGRPDVVHLVLHSILSAPLTREGLVEIYVHTVSDYVIEVRPETRLPRNYMLFTGLMEQLLSVGQVPPDSPNPFMRARPLTLERLVEGLPRPRILLTYDGDPVTLARLADTVAEHREATLILPGFPAQADFSDTAYRVTDMHLTVYRKERLDPWALASHALAAIALRLGVA